jgi:uncharacterized membrane protein HdeD (DUF308 family)
MADDSPAPQEETEEPMSGKDKAIAIVVGLCLLGYGVMTWVNPDLLAVDTSELSGRGGRKVGFWVNLLWNCVAGTIGLLVGLMAMAGAVLAGKESSE